MGTYYVNGTYALVSGFMTADLGCNSALAYLGISLFDISRTYFQVDMKGSSCDCAASILFSRQQWNHAVQEHALQWF